MVYVLVKEGRDALLPRIVDIALELYAISVVATLAGAWGSFFHRRSLERDPMETDQGRDGS
jgi:hypothetical protein